MKKTFFAFLTVMILIPALAGALAAAAPANAASTNNTGAMATGAPAVSVPAEVNPAPAPANAQNQYYKGRVTAVLGDNRNDDPNDPSYNQYSQKLKVTLLNGAEAGKLIDVSYDLKSSDPDERLQAGEEVYVVEVNDGYNASTYYVSDRYRINSLLWLSLIFLALVIAIGRYKGLGSLLGLAFSFWVIVAFMVPRIMSGQNPLAVCLIGSVAIALVSIYIAHGFRLRTTLAVISTMATIALAAAIDYGVIHWAQLFGTGSEDAVYAQFGQNGVINLRGLLLGGIIVGVLGVLDDITTAQAAVVDELHRANPALGFVELYRRGLSIGKEHIASLINTLVLAYVGASFPLVLLFQQYDQPLSYIINSGIVSEEIARSLIGGAALVLAVPLTTALTAYVFTRFHFQDRGGEDEGHVHSHSH